MQSARSHQDQWTGTRRNPLASFLLPQPLGGRRRAPSFSLGQNLTESARRELYECHQERVYRVCLRVTGNASDALDATQEAFLRIFAHFSDFDGRSRLSTWIHSIALNSRRELRRQAARRPCTSLEALGEARGNRGVPVDHRAESPELACARRELARSVRKALRRLPVCLREVAWLRHLEGLAYTELARTLGVPVGTVKSRLSRAHTALALLLESVPVGSGIASGSRSSV